MRVWGARGGVARRSAVAGDSGARGRATRDRREGGRWRERRHAGNRAGSRIPASAGAREKLSIFSQTEAQGEVVKQLVEMDEEEDGLVRSHVDAAVDAHMAASFREQEVALAAQYNQSRYEAQVAWPAPSPPSIKATARKRNGSQV